MLDQPALDPKIMQAIERLDYRVTIGDVAAQAGMNPLQVEQGLLALAAQTQGNLQVTEQGDIIYVFPKNFRGILQEKFWQLQVQAWLTRSWQVIFYGIRVSFGLITILVVIATVIVSVIVILGLKFQSSSGGQRYRSEDRSDYDNDRSSQQRNYNDGMGMSFGWNPIGFLSPIFSWNTDRDRQRGNFLETIYSFVFGDGNPNRDLEEVRWQTIAQVIRQHQGAVVAEQITPFLDSLGHGFDRDYESYMLPVLTRFNGSPEVSPQGQFVYHFSDLQKTVAASPASPAIGSSFLEEKRWKFSQADSTGLYIAGVLGIVILVLSLWLLGVTPGAPRLSGNFRSFAGVTTAYSLLYLGIPLVRGWAILDRNEKISARNHQRKNLASQLTEPDQILQEKLSYAQQFAQHDRLDEKSLLYTTEKDLLEQDLEQRDRIDAEWEQRLRDQKRE
jgi:hypothetical protein